MDKALWSFYINCMCISEPETNIYNSQYDDVVLHSRLQDKLYIFTPSWSSTIFLLEICMFANWILQ